jgi:small multidrug resistance family-3 protein
MTIIIKSIIIFVIAGIWEVGGGYLVWLWLKEDRPFWLGGFGLIILGLYGIVATLQTSNFGRVYAAYGGIFIVLSILWGWQIDDIQPDKFDIIGGLIALIGTAVIMFAPRT